MQQSTGQSPQQDMLRQRLPYVILAVIVISVLLMLRVVSFQLQLAPRVIREFTLQRESFAGDVQRFETPRGNIYDRNGDPLAYNLLRYRVGISPIVVSDPATTATQLAAILERDELEIYNLLTSRSSYELLESQVDAVTWGRLSDLDLYGFVPERIQRRVYPQLSIPDPETGVETTLAAQVLGFVAGEGEDASGYNGIEGYYEQRLGGTVRNQEVSNLPFDLPEDTSAFGRGADLVLTLDRDVQYLVEEELARAIQGTGAQTGTIIVMEPSTGFILGMASWPGFNANLYYEYEDRQLRNPAISDVYEPGSVFKVLTVAAGLEMGAITPDWTYNDQGRLEVGGRVIQNWDRNAYGVADTQQILVQSLNIGAATVALELGWEDFYGMLDLFGIGSLTRVDMQGEEAGILRTPTSPTGDWSESDLATNSFGQGVSVTPLQMLTSINAIANDGLMMEPRVVYQMVDGDRVLSSPPLARRRSVSAETADIVTQMMVAAVRDGLDDSAQLPGYTVAGKTGTAQIPGVTGYLPGQFNMTFVGFLPADDPQVSVLVLLNRPQSGNFASQTAAPVFANLASRLVNLLEIPPDDVRQALAISQAATGTP